MKKILTILFVLLISQVSFAQTKIDEYGRLILFDKKIVVTYNNLSAYSVSQINETDLHKNFHHINL